MTDAQFKQDNLSHIEAVGKWSIPTLLALKRWSDEKVRWTSGILRYRESDGAYIWYEPSNFETILNDIKANLGNVVSRTQIEQLIDDGWMVDG